MFSAPLPVNHRCPIAVISTLLYIGTGDVLFTSDDKITNITDCKGKELLAFNGSMVTLTDSMHTLCVDNFECTFICAKANNVIILDTHIKRNYNVSFDKEVYTGSVQEMATEDSAVRLDADLSIKFHNCIFSNFPVKTRQFELSQTVPPVPFRWITVTNPNSLAVRGEIDYETNTSLTFYVKVRIPYLDNGLVNQPLETSPPIFAFDPDRSFNQTILYSIRAQPMVGLFAITCDGKIIVTRTLDYKEHNNYMIVIQASQKDKPTLSTALAPVLVNVIARNDQVPKDIQEHTIIIAAVISSLVTITVVIAASVIIGCLLMKRLPLNKNCETSTRVRKAGCIFGRG